MLIEVEQTGPRRRKNILKVEIFEEKRKRTKCLQIGLRYLEFPVVRIVPKKTIG